MVAMNSMTIVKSNFREIKCGNIEPGVLFRSNHPIGRFVQIKDIALKSVENKIAAVINLSDTEAELKNKLAYCPWYKKLYTNGNVICIGMEQYFNYHSPVLLAQVASIIEFITNHNGPYLIHCYAGIDRTGFIARLLEALMGASMPEIIRDHMLTFVEEDVYTEKDYNTGRDFILDEFSKMCGCKVSESSDFRLLTSKYLLKQVNISQNDLILLTAKLQGINMEILE
jgi:protein tyrosine/serine phosphatase